MHNQPVSELLIKWRQGDRESLDKLIPMVYRELREIAHRFLGHERPDHTLRSTALVHEAYLRLVQQGPVAAENRAHFVAVAACLMRQILVDYARAHGAAKRKAGVKVEFDEAMALPKPRAVDVVALDDALSALAHVDEQQSRIVELRFFGGLTTEETAEVLQISRATVKRDWNIAKAWLTREMTQGNDGADRAVGKD